MKKIIVTMVVIITVLSAVWLVFFRSDTASDGQKPNANARTQGEADPEQPEGFDKTQFSITDPESIWVIANKHRQLNPQDYRPSDLVVPNVRLRVPGHETMQVRKEVAGALEDMFADAEAAGVPLMLSSAYRSHAYQTNLYNSYVNSVGREAADRESARPGHSEHQTGLSIDVRPTNGKCELDQCFGDMAEGKWVAENAHKYGFIIRYSKTNEAEAGYAYEPWHLRYVGKVLAEEYVKQKATSLEAFFEIDFAPDYD